MTTLSQSAATMRVVHTLVLATGNRHKIDEMRDHIRKISSSIKVRSIKEWVHQFAVDESGRTFATNAKRKAKEAIKICRLPVLADDSGLEVDALKGDPGVDSAIYAGPKASDEANNRKLLKAMKKVPDEKRTARYVCHLTFMMPDGERYDVEETVEGMITKKPVGINGFGYDPLFYLPQLECTMAELRASQKNTLSHRGLAIEAMIKKLHAAGLID